MKSIIFSILMTFIFLGCGENTTSGMDEDGNAGVEWSFNTEFEKFNRFASVLSVNALHPTESNPTLFTDDEWIMSKKKNTDFYISEWKATSILLSQDEAKDFCSNLAIDAQGLNWRLPTNNELLVISELYQDKTFYWSADTTTIISSVYNDSVYLNDGFVCKAQYVYDPNTDFGSSQLYCNEELSGKFAMCVADTQ